MAQLKRRQVVFDPAIGIEGGLLWLWHKLSPTHRQDVFRGLRQLGNVSLSKGKKTALRQALDVGRHWLGNGEDVQRLQLLGQDGSSAQIREELSSGLAVLCQLSDDHFHEMLDSTIERGADLRKASALSQARHLLHKEIILDSEESEVERPATQKSPRVKPASPERKSKPASAKLRMKAPVPEPVEEHEDVGDSDGEVTSSGSSDNWGDLSHLGAV